MNLCLWLLLAVFLLPAPVHGQLVINEVLINPPGTGDVPHEYVEIRGTPNMIIPLGTYFVCIEGDTNGNPGTVQNVFDLSGQSIGGNGFLVLLQKTNSYLPHTNCTALVNSASEAGFGSGSNSSIEHKGEGGQFDFENGSGTFFLIQSTNDPPPGTDIDADNNGVPDGTVYPGWSILDSVGVLDNDGPGDIAYGAINFRRNAGALAFGNVVPVSFNPSYLGRTGNTSGSAANAWLASDGIGGVAPGWTLGSAANTIPSGYAGQALNHIGAPNFGAAALVGVVAWHSGGSTDVVEGGTTDSYALGLPVAPSGGVVIQITAERHLQISIDNGATFGKTRTVTFTSTAPKVILVKALVDSVVDTAIHHVPIRHTIISTGDTAKYSTNSVLPTVLVRVAETKRVLLSEIKVNPPGPVDGPYEFFEVRGEPNLLLTNLYFLALDGNISDDPGEASLVVNLSGARLGSSGLLVFGGYGFPYPTPLGTDFVPDVRFDQPGGALPNGSVSFLLVSSPKPIDEGTDLDNGDNGVLEDLPRGTTILDAIAWSDGDIGDIPFGGVLLTQKSGVPDAASRFDYDLTPLSAPAWYNGDLEGPGPESLLYEKSGASGNFPLGAGLTPGIYVNQAPSAAGLRPLSGVIGDPTNPALDLELRDPDTEPASLQITVISSNQLVVPDSNLTLVPAGGRRYTLYLNPVGVGYSWIRLVVRDDDLVVTQAFHYAASARGVAQERFHSGMCDASAAYPLDSQYMWVADDENQTLKLYDRTRSGEPVAKTNLDDFLGLTDFYEDGSPREVDTEGVTVVGNRLYWIGSHSFSLEAERRPNRARIFATEMAGTGTNMTLTYAGRYEYLLEDLVAWDANNLHGKGAHYFGLAASTQEGVDPKAPDGSGFNIEGLCMAPGSSTTAYVSFRAPIVPATNRNYALLIPILNFTSLAGTNLPPGSAVIGEPIELDLYGRGIRSIEGSDAGFVIVGGPSANRTNTYPVDFRLYQWTGNPIDQPQQLSADLAGMNPEAIVGLPPAPWTANTLVQLLSDNGTVIYYNDSIEAKHLDSREFKKFRSDWVPFGPTVKPSPIIKTMSLSGGNVTIQWRALKNETYRLQVTTQLQAQTWTDVPGDVVATGPVASKTISISATPCFYRVAVLP